MSFETTTSHVEVFEMLLKHASEVGAIDRPLGPSRNPTWEERLMVKDTQHIENKTIH